MTKYQTLLQTAPRVYTLLDEAEQARMRGERDVARELDEKATALRKKALDLMKGLKMGRFAA